MEIWKDIKYYEGLYQVSSLGNVKSLVRYVNHNYGGLRIVKERMLKKPLDNYGYQIVTLNNNSKGKTFKIHQLVAVGFLCHEPNGMITVVDHINNIKTDNRVENLQLITNRENCSKDKKGSSIYTGVNWCKRERRWMSYISINKKKVFLGRFTDELEASNAYQKALKKL